MNSIMILVLLISTPVSPRVHGMGVHFGRIIADTPTDVVYNPARIMSINRFILFSHDLRFGEDSLVQGVAFRRQQFACGFMGNVRVSDWGGLSQGFLTQRDSTGTYLQERNRVSSDEELNRFYSIVPIIGYSFSNNFTIGISYRYKSHETGQRFDVEDRTVRYEFVTLPGTTWVDTIKGIFDSSFVDSNTITSHTLKLGSSLSLGKKSVDFGFAYSKFQEDSVWYSATENDSFNKFGIREYIEEGMRNTDGSILFKGDEISIFGDFSYDFGKAKVSLGGDLSIESGKSTRGDEVITWLTERWVLYNDTIFIHDTLSVGDTTWRVSGETTEKVYTVFAGGSFSLSNNLLYGLGVRGVYSKSRKEILRSGEDWEDFALYRKNFKKMSFNLFSGFEYSERYDFLFNAEYTGRFGINFETGNTEETIYTWEMLSSDTREINENISDFSFTYCLGVKFSKNFELMFVMHNYEYGNFGFVWEF
jgi:hypothetical protein